MALNKITVYKITITAELVLAAESDADALAEAQAWVKSDVNQLNYAMDITAGYQSDGKIPVELAPPVVDAAAAEV